MSSETEPTVAEQMDPGDSNNTLDKLGNGTEWDPKTVLAAAEAAAEPKRDNDD